MSIEPEPLLYDIDWGEQWRQARRAFKPAATNTYWDGRSKTYTTKDQPNAYVQDFLRLAGIKPEESVFDMGCGTGALALPLAQDGHTVVAADFSQGMLDRLHSHLHEQQIDRVTTMHMSWEDDWSEHGLTPASFDVCIASRSASCDDMEAALLKLESLARRRVFVTLPTSTTPRIDKTILAEIGVNAHLSHDHLYAFNILTQHGRDVEVRYIDSIRHDSFTSAEDAFGDFSRMIDDCGARLNDDERAEARRLLEQWLSMNLIPNEAAGRPDKKGEPEGPLCLKHDRNVRWAFLSWSPLRA